MRNDLIEVVFVIDASGSMATLRDDTIGGFNSVIESQKKQPGETLVSTIFFNGEVYVANECVNVQDVQPLTAGTYPIGGLTALYDAVGYAIDSVGKRLSDTPEDQRPAEVMVVIVTDGCENCSQEYKFSDIKERIERQQNVYSWKFMFLGADIKSVEHAQSLGITKGMTSTYSYNKKGTDSVYNAIDRVMTDSKIGYMRGVGYTTVQAAAVLDEVVE